MFTEEEFIQVVLDVVDETPDHTAPCSYVQDGGPGCLIGTALHRLGVSLDTLTRLEGKGADIVLVRVNRESMSSDVYSWAVNIQNQQDGGHEWGTVIDFYPPPNLPR